MKSIEIDATKTAGAKIIFEFVNDKVEPSEALAQAFAEAVAKLLKENPWHGSPPWEVAMAWSLASVVSHAASMTKNPKEFTSDVIGTLEGFYNPN